jgi:hypothetical protein
MRGLFWLTTLTLVATAVAAVAAVEYCERHPHSYLGRLLRKAPPAMPSAEPEPAMVNLGPIEDTFTPTLGVFQHRLPEASCLAMNTPCPSGGADKLCCPATQGLDELAAISAAKPIEAAPLLPPAVDEFTFPTKEPAAPPPVPVSTDVSTFAAEGSCFQDCICPIEQPAHGPWTVVAHASGQTMLVATEGNGCFDDFVMELNAAHSPAPIFSEYETNLFVTCCEGVVEFVAGCCEGIGQFIERGMAVEVEFSFTFTGVETPRPTAKACATCQQASTCPCKEAGKVAQPTACAATVGRTQAVVAEVHQGCLVEAAFDDDGCPARKSCPSCPACDRVCHAQVATCPIGCPVPTPTVVQVENVEPAPERPVVRFYSLRDILTDATDPDEIVRLIGMMVAPECWEVNGGQGIAVFYPAGQCLIVRAPATVQEEVGDFLTQMRAMVIEATQARVQPTFRPEPVVQVVFWPVVPVNDDGFKLEIVNTGVTFTPVVPEQPMWSPEPVIPSFVPQVRTPENLPNCDPLIDNPIHWMPSATGVGGAGCQVMPASAVRTVGHVVFSPTAEVIRQRCTCDWRFFDWFKFEPMPKPGVPEEGNEDDPASAK